MGYVTKADMISRFGEAALIALTDREAGAAIDDAVLNAAIADADAEVTAHLQGRYSVPLAEVPSILTRVAATIVYGELHTLDVPDAVAAKLKWARQLLKDIAAGTVRLGDADGDGAAPAASTSGPAYDQAATPTFAGGGLADFVSPTRTSF